MSASMQDKRGATVYVGDRIRVLKLPDCDYSARERHDLNTFIGQVFSVEAIEYNRAEVSQRFGTQTEEYWHVLFLCADEFEKVSAEA